MKRRPVINVTYTPGHFTALMREHNWPPMFEARIDREMPKHDAQAVAVKALQTAIGRGHTGTIVGALSGRTPASRGSASKAAITPARREHAGRTTA